MSKFIELIEKIYPLSDQSKPMTEIIAILDDHFEEICIINPTSHSDVMRDIHIIVHGPYFDSETAEYAVKNMENEDGTFGQKISISESNEIARAIGVAFDKFNQYDWYYTLNMIHSDFWNTLGSNQSVYHNLAKSWIMDKDAPKGKAFLYYKAMSDAK